ncbi:helix-turn-helix domain-containing protein [Bradyrhizobium uaiense]|uniref:Chromosomal replication initiator DnaA C-terminal domain-containing protein n=1 Tax=Bradyrhizobium uaiense TaxID=2594946 RepID=A0A6P1B8G5_9BRAD|nr:helix-turn-helix domain-containing protein [Bradyrhizobium uaiense]NEU94788.1 hypothetical protein [Bradyrhizobium uaiense]
MNAHFPTPTQALAIGRRRAFHQTIADGAAKLATGRAAPAGLAFPARPVPRINEIAQGLTIGLPDWYFVIPKPCGDEYDPAGRPRVSFIQSTVAKHFHIPLAELLSDSRTKEVVRPRQIAMYFAKELAAKSMPEIGRRFGGKDHTTALHAHRKISRLVAEGGEVARTVAILKTVMTER